MLWEWLLATSLFQPACQGCAPERTFDAMRSTSASLCRSAWYAPAELGELELTDAEAKGEGVPEAEVEGERVAEAEADDEPVAEAETDGDAEAEAECVADPVLSGPAEVPVVAS